MEPVPAVDIRMVVDTAVGNFAVAVAGRFVHKQAVAVGQALEYPY